MAIEEPISYGDFYWASQLEAATLIEQQREKELSEIAGGLIADFGMREIIPPEFLSLLSQIEAPAGAFLGDVGGRFVSEVADGVVSSALAWGFTAAGYKGYEKHPTKKMTASSTAALFSRMKIPEEIYMERFLWEGFEPVEARWLYDSLRPYPTIPEIMRWARYHGDPTNTKDAVWGKFDVDVDDYDLHEWLTLQVLSTEQVHRLFRREVISESDANFFLNRIGWRDDNINFVKELGWLIPNPMLLTQGNLQQGVGKEQIIKDITHGDIHPDHAQQYLDAILTKPATQDIVTYTLRPDPDLQSLDERLTKIGIHPDYLELHRELALVIPPISDIITMAVREVFTPAIAARFGQYDDFPAQLEEWGLKKGLSKEWSERYWAAHWALPSASQGFEMLHRGVIDRDDLNRLLRAQDVMPFWRDKLTQIAFRPLTRVDVRRMYREGVLDEAGVYEAYLDHGYAEDNAKRMTEFTIKQTLSAQAKFTSTDVVAAFAKRMINTGEARSLLADLGIPADNISYIISRAEYKRLWDLTESRIAGIKNLYKKGVYDENTARAKLLQLNLPSDEVEVLFEQWWYEKTGELAPTWTKAETLRFAKAGTISKARAKTELQSMGYDEEHIKIYLGTIV